MATIKHINKKWATEFNGCNNIRSIVQNSRLQGYYISLDLRYLIRKNRTKMRLQLPYYPALTKRGNIDLPFMLRRRRMIKYISLVMENFRHRVKIRGVMLMTLKKRELKFLNTRSYKVTMYRKQFSK